MKEYKDKTILIQMNPLKHSELSVKKRGGKIEDYYPIHSFLDSTKELCSDNRHRILHNLWGVRRVVIPIFGHSITNSDGRLLCVKDICEQDHLLPDYRNKFIPTLEDFVGAIEITKNKLSYIENTVLLYQHDQEVSRLLLSPLALTGKFESLVITHNSWFINEILPMIFGEKAQIHASFPSPNILYDHMKFMPWMNNGFSYPSSACQIEKIIHSN